MIVPHPISVPNLILMRMNSCQQTLNLKIFASEFSDRINRIVVALKRAAENETFGAAREYSLSSIASFALQVFVERLNEPIRSYVRIRDPGSLDEAI